MSPVPDVRPTSHDRHDPMLVAALAADDLAGTDRDQAIALTRSCADCATLHDDLLALARATASAPPPFPTPRRDFRLTAADAARLRPSGWRRLVAALSAPRSVVMRPLGMGLATLGLVGLLVGNVQVGGTPVANSAADAGGSSGQFRAAAPVPSMLMDGTGAAAVPASSERAPAAQFPETASAPAASVAPRPAGTSDTFGAAIASAAAGGGVGGLAPIPSDARTAANQAVGPTIAAVTDSSSPGNPAPSDPFRPLNVLFGAAVAVGLGLLVFSRSGSRRSA